MRLQTVVLLFLLGCALVVILVGGPAVFAAGAPTLKNYVPDSDACPDYDPGNPPHGCCLYPEADEEIGMYFPSATYPWQYPASGSHALRVDDVDGTATTDIIWSNSLQGQYWWAEKFYLRSLSVRQQGHPIILAVVSGLATVTDSDGNGYLTISVFKDEDEDGLEDDGEWFMPAVRAIEHRGGWQTFAVEWSTDDWSSTEIENARIYVAGIPPAPGAIQLDEIRLSLWWE